jgi:hypothetical protein
VEFQLPKLPVKLVFLQRPLVDGSEHHIIEEPKHDPAGHPTSTNMIFGD